MYLFIFWHWVLVRVGPGRRGGVLVVSEAAHLAELVRVSSRGRCCSGAGRTDLPELEPSRDLLRLSFAPGLQVHREKNKTT